MDATAYPVTHTDAEWRKRLTPEQYHIMREHGTERAGSCALNWEKRPGVFSCAGCDQPLFESKKQVRERHRLAELQRSRAGLGRDHGRPHLGHDAHRGALRALRLAPRPRVPRRPAADRAHAIASTASRRISRRREAERFEPRSRRLRARAEHASRCAPRNDGRSRCERRAAFATTGVARMNAPPRPKPSPSPPRRPPAVQSGHVGVLLVNLGTPEATDYWSMRRYLKEFLSDRRVIETPRWLWWPILNLVILTRRPGVKGRDYDSIWNKERNEGPLKTITRGASAKSSGARSRRARARGRSWSTGRCATASRRSRAASPRCSAPGCDRILLVPLYPQYCAATTATVCDKAFDALKAMRWQPTLRVAAPYFDDPAYIDALAASTRASLAKLDFEPEVMLASFHGIPQAYFDKGDPYYCHCAKTTRLLREALGPRARASCA